MNLLFKNQNQTLTTGMNKYRKIQPAIKQGDFSLIRKDQTIQAFNKKLKPITNIKQNERQTVKLSSL